MKAIILSQSSSTQINKPSQQKGNNMLYIGGISLLEHQLKLLRKYGITEVLVQTSQSNGPTINHFGNGHKWGIELTYVEKPQFSESNSITKELKHLLTDDFIVLGANTMVNMHLQKFIDFHRKKKCSCTLAVHSIEYPFDNELIETDRNHRITKIYQKPYNESRYYPNLAAAGIYIFSQSIFKFIKKDEEFIHFVRFSPSIIDKISMFAYNTSEYIQKIDSFECLQRVENDWQTGKTERLSYEYKQKAIFLDRDGVINEEISFITKPDDLILYKFTAPAIKKINQSDYKAIVVSNQSAIARNICTLEELQVIHNKLETELSSNKAKLDALYFCPHHPGDGQPDKKSEYITDCNCRKPKPGMLLEAAKDFNLDLSNSFMIGDNGRDIEAGRNAGCITIGVRTGYALKETKYIPDFFFENLEEAVDFITYEPYKEVYEKINFSAGKLPLVITIGGNARSGKSTLASYLKWKFQQDGKKVVKIELNNWLVPESHQHDYNDAFERYSLKKIEHDLQKILAGSEIILNSFVSHPEKPNIPIIYQYSGEDILIIEGTVAISSEIIRDLSDIKIFVDIPIHEQYKRIKSFFYWKGKTDEEIENLYTHRIADEYMLIQKEINLADIIVSSKV